MGVVVLALDWPRSLTSRQVRQLRLAEARPPKVPRAALRWALLRQLIRFYAARRRALTLSWQSTSAQLLRAADAAARQKEIDAWRQRGEVVQVVRQQALLADDDDDGRLARSPSRAVAVGGAGRQPGAKQTAKGGRSAGGRASDVHGNDQFNAAAVALANDSTRC